VEILFGELDSKMAKSLIINSKQSEIDIDRAESLTFNSRNDQIHIEEIASLQGEYRFSSIQVEMLTNQLRVDQNYGDLRIDNVDEGFDSLELTMKKSDATLLVDEFTPFNFSVYLKDGETFSSVPDLITLKRDEEIDDERQMEGYWKEPHPTRRVTVRGESAVINIAKK
jgi:hypothetical protein